MLNTVVGIETYYTILQELPLSADALAQANTKYISDGVHKLSLPPVQGVGAVPLGTAVIIEQVTGTGAVEDSYSIVGEDDSGENIAEIPIPEGATVGFILVIAYGRLQWMILPSILVNGSGLALPAADRLKVPNGGVSIVPTGSGVQLNGDASYSLYTGSGTYVGMHIGPPASNGETLYVIKIW